MSLSDIMGHMDLAVYPQIGLVIFLAVFFAVMVRTFMRRSAQEAARHAAIPLDDPLREGARVWVVGGRAGVKEADTCQR